MNTDHNIKHQEMLKNNDTKYIINYNNSKNKMPQDESHAQSEDLGLSTAPIDPKPSVGRGSYQSSSSCRGLNIDICTNQLTPEQLIRYRKLPDRVITGSYNYDKPIISYGIISYCLLTSKWFIVQRRHTPDFINFIRGSYRRSEIYRMINGLTDKERDIIRSLLSKIEKHNDNAVGSQIQSNITSETSFLSTTNFNNISQLFIDEINSLRIGCDVRYGGIRFQDNYDRFIEYIDDPDLQHNELEWLWPKGKPNFNETNLQSACREFEEESKISLSGNNQRLLSNRPLIETYRGNNEQIYETKYWVFIFNEQIEPGKKQKNSYSATFSFKNEDMVLGGDSSPTFLKIPINHNDSEEDTDVTDLDDSTIESTDGEILGLDHIFTNKKIRQENLFKEHYTVSSFSTETISSPIDCHTPVSLESPNITPINSPPNNGMLYRSLSGKSYYPSSSKLLQQEQSTTLFSKQGSVKSKISLPSKSEQVVDSSINTILFDDYSFIDKNNNYDTTKISNINTPIDKEISIQSPTESNKSEKSTDYSHLSDTNIEFDEIGDRKWVTEAEAQILLKPHKYKQLVNTKNLLILWCQ